MGIGMWFYTVYCVLSPAQYIINHYHDTHLPLMNGLPNISSRWCPITLSLSGTYFLIMHLVMISYCFTLLMSIVEYIHITVFTSGSFGGFLTIEKTAVEGIQSWWMDVQWIGWFVFMIVLDHCSIHFKFLFLTIHLFQLYQKWYTWRIYYAFRIFVFSF